MNNFGACVILKTEKRGRFRRNREEAVVWRKRLSLSVVSDIVEIAGHMEDNIPTGWTDEKQPVAPMGEVTFSYFLRLAGKSADKLADVRAAFGEAETIELPEMDEFAVVTGEMTEARFRKLAAAFEEDIRQTIRYTK